MGGVGYPFPEAQWRMASGTKYTCSELGKHGIGILLMTEESKNWDAGWIDL